MKESRRLLKMLNRQSTTYIEALEKQYPGITKVRRDANGGIIIDDELDNES